MPSPITSHLAPKLSPLALDLIAALRAAPAKWQPRANGGWNIDDMRLYIRRPFEDETAIYEALDELVARKLVRFAGFDESLAYECCYEAVAP
jgi:hypothetical protein